jgi:hypothetical protein
LAPQEKPEGDFFMVTLIRDDESFSMREQSGEVAADYDQGFMAGRSGEDISSTKSFAWQRGWKEAHEYETPALSH